MKFFDHAGRSTAIWLPIIAGPMIALVAFVVGYWIDPLSLKETKAVAAFFFSVLVLMIGQWLVTVTETQKTAMPRRSLASGTTVRSFLDASLVDWRVRVLPHCSGVGVVANVRRIDANKQRPFICHGSLCDLARSSLEKRSESRPP